VPDAVQHNHTGSLENLKIHFLERAPDLQDAVPDLVLGLSITHRVTPPFCASGTRRAHDRAPTDDNRAKGRIIPFYDT
jgi:hypothetical protein